METNNRKQLVTQDNGNIEKIFPKNYMSNIVDEETGESLRIFLLKYNHIDLGYRSSKSSARLAVPIIMRRKGLYITYYLPDDIVITEFFNGNKTEVSDTNWVKDELWVKDVNELNVYDVKISDGSITLDKLSEEVMQLISSKGDITINNFPDNEDLELYTIYQDSNNKIDAIRFKDRDNSNGMAYKYLRKTKNMILSQSDFNQANAIYEIRYDFDLNGSTINIPENCELKFVGGSLKNGDVTGNNTNIESSSNNIIFKNNINIKGTWAVVNIYSKWFDKDETTIFNIFALSNDYHNVIIIDDELVLNNSNELIYIKSNTDIILNSDIKQSVQTSGGKVILNISNVTNVTITGNGSLIGYRDSSTSTGEHTHGIAINNSSYVEISNIKISKCVGDGIYIGGTNASNNIKITNVSISETFRNGISLINQNNTEITYCTFNNINGTDPQAAIDIEPNPGNTNNNTKLSNLVIKDCISGILLIGQHGSINNVTIENISIISDNVNMLRPLLIGSSDNTIIRNCNLDVRTGGIYQAIVIQATSKNTLLENINQISNFAQALTIQSPTIIKNSNFDFSLGGGINILSSYVKLENNKISSKVSPITFGENIENIILENNTIVDLRTIYTSNSFTLKLSKVNNFNILNNIITGIVPIRLENCNTGIINNNTFTKGITNYASVSLLNNTRNIIISNNYFTSIDQIRLAVLVDVGCINNNIINNIITASTLYNNKYNIAPNNTLTDFYSEFFNGENNINIDGTLISKVTII
jgi:hypothetical protein